MNRSRSSTVSDDDGLRLPRPPGVIRRFWARHPVLADVLIAVVCLVLSLSPATVFQGPAFSPEPGPLAGRILLIVLVLGSCTLLLRRRRWPVAVFIAAQTTTIVYVLVLEPAGGPLLFIACYTLAVHRSTRAAWTAFAWSVGSLAVVWTALLLFDTVSLMGALNSIIGQIVLGLIGTLIGANVGGRRRYTDALVERSRQLLVERDQQAQLASAAERARIAREMHDIVSHSLTVIVALSEGAAATPDRQRAIEASQASATTARAALAEMRSMLGVLRDGSADAPLAPSEPTSPEATVEAAQRAGYPVTLTVNGSSEASPAVGFAVGRIVQEGITNAMRHARAATTIDVRLTHTADRVVIEVDNDGVSGSAGTSGFGIRGLQERAAHVGGTLTSAAVGGGHWLLRAELPARTHTDEDTHE